MSFLIFLVSHLGLALPIQDVSHSEMPFRLTVTPEFVSRHTTNNMTLRCERNLSVQTKMVEIFRIRILKQSASGWDLIAEKRDNVDFPTVTGAAVASANISGDITNVFLQATWDNIENDSFGVFTCYAMGFDVKAYPVMESSAEIDVHETQSLVAHAGGLSNATHSKLEDLVKWNIDEISELKRNLNRVNIFLDSLTQWPGGYYALLQPKTGCPVDLAFFGGTHKFHKIHTESQSSSDKSDIYSSVFSSKTLSSQGNNNFFNLEFCEVTRQFNKSNWPQGSFCIHKVHHYSCPSGFTDGRVYIDTENIDPSGDARNNVADTVHDPYFYFCCQDGGLASDPIQLPTSSPFLLYRYGGECQSVQGMSVSEEFIQINTELYRNDDSVYVTHPDVDRPGSVIKFHLCYYK